MPGIEPAPAAPQNKAHTDHPKAASTPIDTSVSMVADEHVRHCVAGAASGDGDRMVTEATDAIKRLLRT